MARFENVQGITEVKFFQNIQCYCPLGDDWYTNRVEVTMKPDRVVPDYCELDDFTRSLGGEKLIIEDVIDAIYSHIMEEYEPYYLSVVSSVDDAKHMAVVVSKVSE